MRNERRRDPLIFKKQLVNRGITTSVDANRPPRNDALTEVISNMAVNTKVIKRRIKSIGNIRKITKAVEMTSAVKMRRAVVNVLATRSYATLAWEMLTEIAKKTDVTLHPLLQKREIKKIGIILITSNRGLAGGFSSRLLQTVNQFIKTAKTDLKADVQIYLIGKQGRKIYQKFGHTVTAEFDKIDLTTKVDEILPLAQTAVKDYVEGKIDMIFAAYTDFVSALKQSPKIKQILPLENNDIVNSPISVSSVAPQGASVLSTNDYGYLFEPGTKEVLDVLLPRLVEMQVYQTVLESDASEHSARMIAMRNASDAAKDIIKELNYTFNKARQASITQEISEIVGGAAALE